MANNIINLPLICEGKPGNVIILNHRTLDVSYLTRRVSLFCLCTLILHLEVFLYTSSHTYHLHMAQPMVPMDDLPQILQNKIYKQKQAILKNAQGSALLNICINA